MSGIPHSWQDERTDNTLCSYEHLTQLTDTIVYEVTCIASVKGNKINKIEIAEAMVEWLRKNTDKQYPLHFNIKYRFIIRSLLWLVDYFVTRA